MTRTLVKTKINLKYVDGDWALIEEDRGDFSFYRIKKIEVEMMKSKEKSDYIVIMILFTFISS